MKISKEEVLHIADLSKLEIEEKDLDNITEKLSEIVEFANNLSKINVDNVKPTAHILDIKNVFREDKVEKSFPRECILKNAPKSEAGCISVPKVLE